MLLWGPKPYGGFSVNYYSAAEKGEIGKKNSGIILV
jgi:hypothetical protein